MIRRVLRGLLWLLWALICFTLARMVAPAIGPPAAIILWIGAMALPRFWPLVIQQARETLKRIW